MTEGNISQVEEKPRFGVRHFIVKKLSAQSIPEGTVQRRSSSTEESHGPGTGLDL